MRLTVLSSLARICARSWAIIWATVNCSCCNSMRETSLRRSRTCWKTRTRSTMETTSSPSVPSSWFIDLLFLVQELRGVLEFFVLHEALDQVGARVGGLLFRARERVGREQHFRFDVDQRSGHVDEIGGDVHV